MPELDVNATQRAAQIRLMIFDVDGILTDGSLHFSEQGEIIKSFHVLDGHGLKMLQQAGITTAIISARQSPILATRAIELGISHVHQGSHNKLTTYNELLSASGLNSTSVGYMADDIMDLPVLTRVGFAISVPNGHLEVQKRVHYLTHALGGRGAVREVCDFILQAQGHYDAALAAYVA